MAEMNKALELIQAAQAGDTDAMGMLIREHNGLIWYFVRKVPSWAYNRDDFYQEACLALILCIRNFDPTRGTTSLAALAVPYIRARLLRAYTKTLRPLSASEGSSGKAYDIYKWREDYLRLFGAYPSINETKLHFGAKKEQTIIQLINLSKMGCSLNAPIKGSEEGAEFIGSFGAPEDETALIYKIMLSDALDKLPEKQRRIIIGKYAHGKTQDQMARELGVSQAAISRTEAAGLRKLRMFLEDDGKEGDIQADSDSFQGGGFDCEHVLSIFF